MAAPIGIETIINTSCKTFLKSRSVDVGRISVQKQSNQFDKGDFFVPSGCLSQCDKEVLFELKEEINDRLRSAGVPVNRVEESKHANCAISVYLDRACYFKEIIQLVIAQGVNYGLPQNKKDTGLLLCNDSLLNKKLSKETGDTTDTNLDDLRSLILQEHCTQLLKCHGYSVHSYIGSLENISDLLSQLGADTSRFVCATDDNTSDTYCLQNSKFVSQSQHCISEIPQGNETSGSQCDSQVTAKQEQTEVIQEFNLKRCISEKGLCIGRNSFDKNLSSCTVFSDGRPVDIVETAGRINECLKKDSISHCIHLAGQSRAFSTQKLHLILQELAELSSRSLQQKHFIYGPVVKRREGADSEVNNADELFRLRYAQLRQAAILKYGEGVHGEGWAATLESLTAACIRFELLSCVHRNTLKLDVSDDDGDGQSTSEGSFVMYNCARIATLFRHFEEAVESETYPVLPPLELIDFSTLREEAEWGLLFNFVDTFPDLVRSAVEDMDSPQTIHVQIHTHKVCNMLCSLSRSLSSYYSRYHVLGEARSQLLPTMYARLYLLKAVHQVMINGLRLMGIHPLSQL